MSRTVEPGWYIVYARDGGQGNRTGYELRIDITRSPSIRILRRTVDGRRACGGCGRPLARLLEPRKAS